MGRDIKHVKSSDGGIVLRHPRLMNSTEWVDVMWRWPQVSYGIFLMITRGFYLEVQISLFCTKLKACKLLIWYHSKQVMLHIPYDEAFCADCARLRAFYLRDMLPFVSDEYNEGRLLLCERYMQLCK